LKRPHGWGECISAVLKADIKRFFQLSNPDGYLYLLFLKTASVIFLICKPHLF
jgi:hypothetical protein